MAQLGEILEARKVEEGLGSEIWVRGISTERIFWEARDAKSEWARGGVNNILLYELRPHREYKQVLIQTVLFRYHFFYGQDHCHCCLPHTMRRPRVVRVVLSLFR